MLDLLTVKYLKILKLLPHSFIYILRDLFLSQGGQSGQKFYIQEIKNYIQYAASLRNILKFNETKF